MAVVQITDVDAISLVQLLILLSGRGIPSSVVTYDVDRDMFNCGPVQIKGEFLQKFLSHCKEAR